MSLSTSELSSNVHCIDNYHKPTTAHANREIKKQTNKKKTYIPVASRLTINLGFICVYLNLTTAKMLPFLIPQVSACACICGGSASGRRYSRGMMPWSASCSRVLLCWSLSCRTEVGGGWGWGKRMKSKEMTGESKDKKKEMKGKDEKVWKHRWGSDNRGRKRLRIHATQNVVRVQ